MTTTLGATRVPIPLGDAMRLILAEAVRLDGVQADVVAKGLQDAPAPSAVRRATACRRAHEILGAVLPYAEQIGETIEKLRRYEGRLPVRPTAEEIETSTADLTLWGVVHYLGVAACEIERSDQVRVECGLQDKPNRDVAALVAALDAARDIVEVVATYPKQIADRLRQLRDRGPRR